MRTCSEALELAVMSARNARTSSNKEVARELWKMAQEYQAEAAKLASACPSASRTMKHCRPRAWGWVLQRTTAAGSGGVRAYR
jgi:hypothetical protein